MSPAGTQYTLAHAGAGHHGSPDQRDLVSPALRASIEVSESRVAYNARSRKELSHVQNRKRNVDIVVGRSMDISQSIAGVASPGPASMRRMSVRSRTTWAVFESEGYDRRVCGKARQLVPQSRLPETSALSGMPGQCLGPVASPVALRRPQIQGEADFPRRSGPARSKHYDQDPGHFECSMTTRSHWWFGLLQFWAEEPKQVEISTAR